MSTVSTTVTVTGASGQISYGMLFRIAAGEMLGRDTRVRLRLLEIPTAVASLEGVAMELEDGAYPLLESVDITDDPQVAFKDAGVAMLVGARPRTQGMQRSDLLAANGVIFTEHGAAINKVAADDVRVLVVGNPANTNALIAMANAPDVPRERFTAMTRLDHNRAVAQLARKAGVAAEDVARVSIWGNHSASQYPDLFHATVAGRPALEVVEDALPRPERLGPEAAAERHHEGPSEGRNALPRPERLGPEAAAERHHEGPSEGRNALRWLEREFIPTVAERGTAIIKARGASSAASAASAAIDHVHDWVLGTAEGDWTSMAVCSDGSYGVPEGLISSFPVTCAGGEYRIVSGLEINEFSRPRIAASVAELEQERELAQQWC